MEDNKRQLDNRNLTEEYNRFTGHGTLYPVIFDTANRCEITDIEGNKYTDFSSGYGVINAGWQRKELIKVMQTQAEKSCFSIQWMGNPEATRLAEKLIRLTPEKLQKCIRATGGGDANELGIKAVYSRHGGDILSFYYSYHGGTSVTLSVGDSKRFHFPGNPARLAEFKVYPPYCYRCPFNQCYGKCSFECAESVDDILKENPNIKVMILEPVIGSGGIIVPPGEYWKILREICYRYDIKLIVDEVMTGFGRTGSLFAVDQMEIVPDVLTLSKGMCSGYVPIGAAIMTSELSDHICKDFNDVTSTYAWTPLACAVSLANINLIIQEKLCEKLGLPFTGNGKLIIDHVCGHNSINSHGIAYFIRKKDMETIDMPDNAAIVVPPGTIAEGKNLVYSEYPLDTHVEITRLFYQPPYASGAVHPTAILAQDVILGRNVTIDANVTIYSNVNIGDNTIIRAGTVIMEGTFIGKDCIIDPNVTICERSNIGNRVIINGGAVIGAADLGFYQKDGIHIRIPQVGQVILEDDVEVGPGTVINRGRLENTIVRKGCKLDAHVLISHNVDLGEHSMIIGQSAIAGSTKTGHHFTAAGQSGVVGHLRIGNNVTLGARGVITKDTPDNIALAGFPAVPHIKWKRNVIILNRIDS